jgi:hypothetical protein
MPKTVEPWSLTSLPQKLVKRGVGVVSHDRYVAFQMATSWCPGSFGKFCRSLPASAPPAPVPENCKFQRCKPSASHRVGCDRIF